MLPIRGDQQALLRAIGYAPEDDAPRLIYADWLDEHEQAERANLIRWMIRAPSYTFFWSRRAKSARHYHTEAVQAIRGLKPRLMALCREEWALWEDVEMVTVRRGFASAIAMPAAAFIAQAGAIFSSHPIESVRLGDCHFDYATDRPGHWRVDLATHSLGAYYWPVQLFPEFAPWSSVYYRRGDDGMADMSRRAAGYGRRQADIIREPPPLPKRFEPAAAWHIEPLEAIAV